MTDNRTTELLEGLRDVGNLHEFAELFGFDWQDESDWTWHDVAVKMADDFEQAIAATLGSGECELAEVDSYRDDRETIHVLECSACGETCEHVNGSYPRCPHCGRKAVNR